MAGSNPALRIVSTGEIVTVARWRARRMIESGRAVPVGGGDALAEIAGSADQLASDPIQAAAVPVKPAAGKRGEAAGAQS